MGKEIGEQVGLVLKHIERRRERNKPSLIKIAGGSKQQREDLAVDVLQGTGYDRIFLNAVQSCTHPVIVLASLLSYRYALILEGTDGLCDRKLEKVLVRFLKKQTIDVLYQKKRITSRSVVIITTQDRHALYDEVIWTYCIDLD